MSPVSEVLAVVEDETTQAEIVEVAKAIATVLHASVTPMRLTDANPTTRPAAILARLASPDVRLAVLPSDAERDGTCWSVAGQAHKPVVLVSERARAHTGPISRVLLPLDGTPEAAAAADAVTELLADAGVDLVVLHVFDASTVPPFWDQPAHALSAWGDEFLARNVRRTGARLTVRSGSPEDQVVAVAEEEQAQLIALGWSQKLSPGRARTVRNSVRDAPVPVLLLPIDGA